MRAQGATGRSGEAGELLLYLLTEWILDAPQIVAKMSLKTNRDMPVHGSDGIHVKFMPTTGQLIVYSGEAKMHAKVSDAIRAAVASIGEALTPEKADHELQLVRRDLNTSGLDPAAHAAFLSYLDPWSPLDEQRVDAVTCLIGFNFAGYGKLKPAADAEDIFRRLAIEQLERSAQSFADALAKAGHGDRLVELFLLPLPSVDELRKLFSARLGQAPA